jgi:TetR/AcrR family transcriptional repressor of nem operon
LKTYKAPTQSENLRSKALKSARNHLQTKGFNGFSFQTVADDLGIRKASLHYYFASKDQLGLELLQNYRQAFEVWAEKVKDLGAREKVQQTIDFFVKLSDGGQRICPIGALCADFNSLSPTLQKALKEFTEDQKKWLIELLQQGQKEKVISKKINPRLAAEGIASQIQGVLQMARIHKNDKLVKDQLESLFRLMKN